MSLSNRCISAFLILTHVLWISSSVFADSTQVTAASSPEFKLLAQVIAFSGNQISTAELSQSVRSAVQSYDQNSPLEGREQRLAQATLDLGLYTRAQAQQLLSNLKSTSTANAGQSVSSDQINAEIQALLAKQPVGAQFSSCTAYGVGGRPLHSRV